MILGDYIFFVSYVIIPIASLFALWRIRSYKGSLVHLVLSRIIWATILFVSVCGVDHLAHAIDLHGHVRVAIKQIGAAVSLVCSLLISYVIAYPLGTLIKTVSDKESLVELIDQWTQLIEKK